MRDAVGELASLLQRCLVWIEAADGSAGSGVWIAPGKVLTCAHVARTRDLVVVWEGERYPASVLESVPLEPSNAGLWPYPDLALASVPGAIGHPCAWLSDRPVSFDATLLAFGHAAIYDDMPRLNAARGSYGGPAQAGNGELLRFVGDELARGMSGGPVLDTVSGAVCGLVKTTREEGTNLGGLIVPLHGMRGFSPELWRDAWRAHDIVHGDGVWLGIRKRLPDPIPGKLQGMVLAPSDEVALLRLLAVVRPSKNLADQFVGALYRPIRRLPAVIALDFRDLMYELGEQPVRPGELFGPIRLAANLAGAIRGDLGRDLQDWSTRVAIQMGQQSELDEWRARLAPGEDDEPIIVVQVEPGALIPGRYCVTIWVHDGPRATKVYADDAARRTIADVRSVVSQHLTELLQHLHGQGTIELVLPPELFNEDFDEMVTGRRSRLGRTNPVVLRDLERLTAVETWHAWRARWRQFRAGLGSVEWLDCADRSDPDQLDGRFRSHGDIGVLALTRRLDGTAREALDVALYAGVPIAVWRRDACAEHEATRAGESCIGERFRQGFDRIRSERPDLQLPHLVQALRSSAAAGPVGADCRNIVLLWDNPERMPEPYAPLVEPESLEL